MTQFWSYLVTQLCSDACWRVSSVHKRYSLVSDQAQLVRMAGGRPVQIVKIDDESKFGFDVVDALSTKYMIV